VNCQLIAIVLFVTSFALFIIYAIVVGAPYWVDLSGLHSGLWQVCLNGSCTDIPSAGVSSKLKAMRAFGVLAVIFCFFAFVLYAAHSWGKYSNRTHATFLLILTWICALVEWAIYQNDIGSSTSGLGACYWLVVICWPVTFILSIIALHGEGKLGSGGYSSF